MNIYVVAMVRNEIDVIADFISYYLDLADHILIADMQSSDGTREVIDGFAKKNGRVECINLPYFAKYQAETLTATSKRAFKDGADWVFFVDADEFLRVEGRAALEDYLQSFGSDVMHLPWLNLIPSSYGSFGKFDLSQEFFWSGRPSHFKKVALSAAYAVRHPDYQLDAGSHNVRPNAAASGEIEHLGLPMLHVPVRSVERMKYKAANALGLQSRKHNQAPGEGAHHSANDRFLAGKSVDDEDLNGIAQNYGSSEPIRRCNPAALGWPRMKIGIKSTGNKVEEPPGPTAIDLLRTDAQIVWKALDQPPGSSISALIDGDAIRLVSQSVRGDGTFGPQIFGSLPADCSLAAGALTIDSLALAAEASLLDPPVQVPSAWTELVPLLGALVSITRPRRFVELGTHNGMSFLSACNFSKILGIGTECVAIDSWLGDAHASFHAPVVFDNFQSNLRNLFPEQYYLRSYFDDASQVFEPGSVDMLHIDGFHAYESVRKDFETWLPKMSARSIVLFHDTSVHDRGFGVWRLWQEVSNTYPGFTVYHGNGLGILFVGDMESDVGKIFSHLARHPEIEHPIKRYFEALNQKRNLDRKNLDQDSDAGRALKAEYQRQLNLVLDDKWWKRTKPFRKLSNSLRKLRGRPKKVWPSRVE